jgi:DNA-binding Lrp family transcriptional regulator
MELIHIDKFPLADVSILISDKFLRRIKKRSKTAYKNTRSLYDALGKPMPFATFKNSLEPAFISYRPLWLILLLCENLRINTKELENDIISYRTKKGTIIIDNPKIPIKVSPIFDMLIAHAIGDGNCTRYKGRIPSFSYRQYRNEILKLYIKKAERVFGKLNYKNEYFFDAKRVHLPSALSYILYTFYSMKPEDFLGNGAYIPEKMMSHSKDHILAVLIAFILDEGYIDSSEIVIGLKNKRLLDDLEQVCCKLGYKTSLKYNGTRGALYILAEGTKNFWKDYKALKRKYPEIDLDYKEQQIKNFIIRKNKKWRGRGQGQTPNNIIKLLKDGEKTVKELAGLLLISRQGTKFHLRGLERMGIVKRIGKGYANSDIYRLAKYEILPVKNRGRSRQYGITDDTIMNLLKQKSMTTRELADEIKVNMATTLHFLTTLEDDGKIKRMGQKIHKTHPSIVWACT